MATDQWARTHYMLNEMVSEVTNRDWRVPPRPWSEFFERFTVPKLSVSKNVRNRLALNLNYFQANYLVLIAIAFIAYLIRNPWSVFEVVVIVTGWVFATSARPLVLRGRRITRKEKFGVMAVVTILFPLLTGVIWSLGIYALVATAVTIVHALFRHASTRHKAVDIRPPVNDKW